MASIFDGLNAACLKAFPGSFSLTYADTLDTATITGIIETGIEVEDRAPGDGTIYARLWTTTAQLNPLPSKGDEIASDTYVYKILKIEEDAADGIWLLIRQDRENY